jgi:hypothetical protein
MTFLPKYRSPCELATSIPDNVAELLDAESGLQRRFREETISDLIVASIKALPTVNLIVMVPEEIRTGSDFDIAVIADDRLEAIQFRLQAKRLTPHETNWGRSSYRELAHPHNTGVQSSTLLRSSSHEKIPTLPLYAFYNPRTSVSQSGNTISGLELADAYEVRSLIKEMVDAKPKRILNKRVENLRHLFFPFSKLLCEPFRRHPDLANPNQVPPPEAFRKSVVDAIRTRSRGVPERTDEGAFLERETAKLPSPSPDLASGTSLEVYSTSLRDFKSSTLPKYMHDALDRREGKRVVSAPIRRPKIVLTSET